MNSGMEIPILLSIRESVNQMTDAKDIFCLYSNIRLTCESLKNHVASDISHFLRIHDVKTEIFVKVFNTLVDNPYKHDYIIMHDIKKNLSIDLSKRMRQLANEKKITELFDLIVDCEPNKSVVKRVNVESLIAKVISKDYCFCKSDDEMITLLALECAKKDARMTAQIFHQIPFIYYLNGEAIGMECARNDPASTLEFIDNFKKRLQTGFLKPIFVDNIIKEANRNLLLKDNCSSKSTKSSIKRS